IEEVGTAASSGGPGRERFATFYLYSYNRTPNIFSRFQTAGLKPYLRVMPILGHYGADIALSVAYCIIRLWLAEFTLGRGAPAEMVSIGAFDEMEPSTLSRPPTVIYHLTDFHLTCPRDPKATSPAA